MSQRGIAAAFAAMLALALPSAADAATLCVNKVGPQCEQIFTATQLGAAISKANEIQGSPDRIEIGPGIYDGGPYNASSRVDIIGAGRDETVITNVTPTGLDSAVFLANFENQTISDLTVRIGPGESSRGLQVGSGALVERVRVDAGPGSDPGRGLDGFGATVRQVVVQLPREEFVTAGTVGGTIEDSTFEGGTGLFLGGGVARRVVAVGNTAVSARGARIEDSLLRAEGANGVGLAIGQFDGGEMVLSHVTVAGDSAPGSIGLKAEKGNGAFASLQSVLTVRNTVVTGFATDLTHRGHAGAGTTGCGVNCQISQTTDIAYSALDFPERVTNFGGPGSLNLGAGNVDLGDPRFADAAAGDFRLRFDSPLIDAAEPLPLGSGSFYTGESPVDLGGVERIVDGRAGGEPAARRDIGAREYARRPPSLSVGAPDQALLYRPVNVATSASDPDPFDLLTLRFAFDGLDAGQSSTHVFTTLGTHTATVTVSDPTGVAATATTSFPVRALPGKCTNRRSGGGQRDRFKGTSAGETLDGRGGPDALNGLGGPDCLKGGSGADVLNGGKGKDRLDGGKGNDRISDRDQKRDRIDCGPGDDIATADRKDALRNCETTQPR
jgi:PKD domain-containing protein/hemolysin type calcium-binding protein